MTPPAFDPFPPIKLSELSARIDVEERELRYALARGIVPDGIPKTPGSGHHHQFDFRQSFWLAVAVRLKAAGLKTPLAGKIVKWCERDSRAGFFNTSSFIGQLLSEETCRLEVGDAKYVRIVSYAKSGSPQQNRNTAWERLRKSRTCTDANPIVVVQVNLTELARLLLGERPV